MRFRYVKLSDEMIERAHRKSYELGALKHSFMNGKGNLTGFLAEEVFDFLYPEASPSQDFEKDRVFKGFWVDVKGRRLNVIPQEHYDITIKVAKTYISNDFFYCCAIDIGRMLGYGLGWISRKSFLKCERVKCGELMPQGEIYKGGGYRVLFSDLTDCPDINMEKSSEASVF